MDGEEEEDQEIDGKASQERIAKGWFDKRGYTRSNKMERMCLDDSLRTSGHLR